MSWESRGIELLTASAVRPFALAAAAWLVLGCLKVRHPASRHAAWTAVLIGMVLVPFVSVLTPHWVLPVLPQKEGPGALASAGTAAGAPTRLAFEPIDSVTRQGAYDSEFAGRLAVFQLPVVEGLVLGCYLAGFLAMLAYRLAGWVLLWRVMSRSRRVRAGVRESADVLTPVAVGVLRPAVILPAGWRGWNAKTRRAVLAHEFAHLRRHDPLVSALARLVQCLFWFHPLAWWVSRKVADLSELACDAAALERLDDPAGYSRILLEFAEAVNRAGHRVALPGLAMAANSDMGRRIDQVFELSGGLSDGKLRKLSRPGAVLALMGLPLMCLAATVGLGEPGRRPPRQAAPASQAPKQVVNAQPAAFEVASVKTAADPGRVPMFCLTPCTPGERLSVVGPRVDIRYMSLQKLIVTAYGVKPYQLSGPDWMRSQRFDIAAKIPDGVSKDRIPEMLQALLAERFKLSMHRESREQPVYALVVGKNGPKLKESAADAGAAIPNPPGSRELYTPQGEAHIDGNGNAMVTAGPYGPIRAGRGPGGSLRFQLLSVTMPAFAEVVAPHEDRPVVDMTELKGSYDVEIAMEPPPEGGSRKDGSGPQSGGPPPPDLFGEAIFKVIERAGLKLEPRKAPVDMIVVDHLEKMPTEN